MFKPCIQIITNYLNFCHSYSWLPIIRTLANSNLCANSNQSRFPLDFLLTFTVILPSLTRTLDNSNLPLTRSNFCFPSDHFYTILPSITWTMLKAHDKSGKKPCTGVRNIEFISKQPSQFFVFTILSLQFKFSVHPCILCSLIAFPPHPFAYFLTSGYLLQTPNHSNSQQFELFAISLEGSSYRESTSRPSFEETTYNIQVAKTPWQHLGRKSHCWKAHFFKICFFVKYFRQLLLSLVKMDLHAAIIRLRPLIHEGMNSSGINHI